MLLGKDHTVTVVSNMKFRTRYYVGENGRPARDDIGTYGYIADDGVATLQQLETAIVGHLYLGDVSLSEVISLQYNRQQNLRLISFILAWIL